jgi:hypothetical protein
LAVGLVGLAGDVVEVLEEKQEVRQIVERFVAVPEGGAVPVLDQQLVAEAVDGADAEFAEVAHVAGLARGGGGAVARLVCRLLGEGAEHEFGGRRFAEQQQVDGAEHQAEGLAGAGPGDDQQRPLGVADHGALLVIHRGEGAEQRRDDHQRRPSRWKLNTSSAEMMRWSTTLT